MRQSFIAGNWKMHKSIAEAVSLAQELRDALGETRHKILVAPPFTALAGVGAALEGSAILLGAQNMGPEETGAHTGEVSVLMLKDTGVGAVILGHSERRHVYGETDELINRKVRLALSHDLRVILCVGEQLQEREQGITEKVVDRQARFGLDGVTETQLQDITIAYEPVWAIGTGKTATPQDADAVHAFIRKLVAELYSAAVADSLIIQYGGSVKPDNVKGLMAMPNIDGALVGGASLQADTFLPIAQYDSI